MAFDMSEREVRKTLLEDMHFSAKAAILKPEPIFYDYIGCMIPEKRKPMVNADRLIGLERK